MRELKLGVLGCGEEWWWWADISGLGLEFGCGWCVVNDDTERGGI